MTKLFLRFYIAVSLAFMLSISIAMVSIDDYYVNSVSRDYVRMTRALHQLIIGRFDNLNTTQKKEILREYEKEYPFNIEIGDLGDLDMDERQDLLSNRVYVRIYTSISADEVEVIYPSVLPKEIIYFSPAENFSQPYNRMILIQIAFVLLGFGIALFLVVRPIRRHINKLGLVSAAIGQGDFSHRANEKAPAPLNELAIDINQMSDQLKELIEDKKVLMGAAAHELRTPLARLRFAFDLTSNIKDENELRNHVAEMEEDIEQLEVLVEEVLDFSRLSQGAKSLKPEVVSLANEIDAICEQLLPLRPEIRWENSYPRDVNLIADKAAVNRAISNVIRNGQRYAKEQVKIQLVVQEGSTNVTIEDDGPGLPEKEFNNILRAFYRYDESRSNQSGGSGLGLAIVDKILHQHKGSVGISRSSLGGLKVDLSWPS